MYIPKHFEITNDDEIFQFIETYSFGQLISTHQGELFSTHMPFLLNGSKTSLLGHLAKNNPQHTDIENQQVLVSLEGPHDYISPSWFSTAGVPTWNYQAVHIYGDCKIISDLDSIKAIVDELSIKHEATFEQPWQPDYKTAMLGAIVGLEIPITKIQCKYKLSQNRSKQDQQQIARQLEIRGSTKLAQAMENTD